MTPFEINKLIFGASYLVIALFNMDLLWVRQPLRSWEGRIVLLLMMSTTTALSYLIWWIHN